MNRKPYVGITGVTNLEDAVVLAEAGGTYFPPSASHHPMLGFLVSADTLAGRPVGDRRYPSVAELPGLLASSGSSVLNTIHYHTSDQADLARQVVSVVTNGGVYETGLCRTLQLNMTWPDAVQLRSVRAELPELDFILVLTGRAMRDAQAPEIRRSLASYVDLAAYLLIDPSGGRSLAFDDGFIAPFFRMVRDVLPATTVVLAGGFDGDNVARRLASIADLVGSRAFGVDAEGRLRTGTRVDRHGSLSTPRAIAYLDAAARFFGSGTGAHQRLAVPPRR